MREMICGYEVHPACALLPLMSEAALAEMAEDIKAHGQQQPVILHEGKVLDGRNRLKACEIAGVAPATRIWRGDDPVRWVLSLNFHRRHLTDDQKAVVGARAEQLLVALAEAEAEAPPAPEAPREDAPPDDGAPHPAEAGPSARPPSIEKRARQTAAALVNVSAARIARGRKLLEQAVPELVRAVEVGDVKMTHAAQVARLAPATQEALVAQGGDAVVAEARRLGEARRAQRPSFQRALNELDDLCVSWTVGREGGVYRFVGDAEGGAIESEDTDLKSTVLQAWTTLREREGDT